MADLKRLTNEQVEFYRDNGFLSPIRVLSTAEAAAYRDKLETFEREQGSPLNGAQRSRTYLLFSWAFEILTMPSILDVVEDLIGPDILAYHWTSWIKEPHTPGFVSWHQDATYFGLEPLEQVTAWLALSEASLEAGCMRALPGSQKLGQLASDLKPQENNLLSSGQTVRLQVDDDNTVPMPLKPGEISLHHTCTVHGSGGNQSNDRRIGFCLNYIPAYVKPTQELLKSGAVCSATLVRGRKHHDLFPEEAIPTGDADADAQAGHAAGNANYRRMVQALGHKTAGRFDQANNAGGDAQT